MTPHGRTIAPPTLLRHLELLTSTADGDVLLPGLTLSATEDAVTVSGPQRQVMRSWSWPWSEVTELGADEWVVGSDDRPHQVLELRTGDRRHRFLVAAPDLSEFLAATLGWRLQPGLSAGTSPASGAPAGGASAGGAPAGGAPAGPRTTKRRWVGAFRLTRPHHARLLRVRPVTASISAVMLIAGGATLGTIGTGGAHAANPAAGGRVSIMSRMAKEFASRATADDLPPATIAPEPAPPSLAASPALQSHEIFGFAPYWTLPQASGFNVSDLTTIAYFSVDVNGDGSIQSSGPGWTGYESQDFADLVTRAHAAGARVVLTATCFGQTALNQLTSDPTAPMRLAAALVQLVSAKNLDGVNFDFEGQGSGDRGGLDSLMAQVSGALRQADPHWQVTMDTYASSAGDPGGFYDIAGLAPSVDAFFVMAYDMNGTSPSPTAPLTGSGFTDLDALQQYTSAVPASKVILGVPYYGYDWPTTGPGLGAAATSGSTALGYGQIATAGHPVYWDPTTQTAWTTYQVGTQWHQTWFDDPTSLALKARLAAAFHIAGVGVWALGMDGNDPSMLAALLGNAPVVKDFLPGPVISAPVTPGTSSTTTTTAASGSGYHYSGVWNGSPVSLTPAVLASLPGIGTVDPVGVLSGFSTDDPAEACLTAGGTLSVSAIVGESGVFLVTAQTPQDCASGAWTFVANSGGAGGSGTTTTTSTTTTTTTTTSTTTTTTTTTTAPPG